MDLLLSLLASFLIRGLQKLSLPTVARFGRACGALVYWLDGRHRRVAIRNLTLCFGKEKRAKEIRELARENFRRIGENFACAVKTASMSVDELRSCVEFVAPALIAAGQKAEGTRLVAAIGHFGNFELYARFGQFAPGLSTGTTYRGLRQPSLNRLLQSLREKSGCAFFERRFDAAALKAFMNQDGVLLGLLADQHGGPRGLRLPFLGVECSTSAAPALFALRYSARLFTGVCYRTGLGKWRIEAGPEIPTHTSDGRARPATDIMLEVNRAFAVAVRKDAANWFWVHNRWKGNPQALAEIDSAAAAAARQPSEAAEAISVHDD